MTRWMGAFITTHTLVGEKKLLSKHNKKAMPLKQKILKEVNNFVKKAFLNSQKTKHQDLTTAERVKSLYWVFIQTENHILAIGFSKHLHPGLLFSKDLLVLFNSTVDSPLDLNGLLRHGRMKIYTHISQVKKQFIPFFMSRKGGLLKQYGQKG